ncbi:MAG TPA: metallophosphoesterase [Candidatus Nanoarchaeia archaeon]|nr:metallophosphoesterase [Candidatus Nanoarchaeia archaeon]
MRILAFTDIHADKKNMKVLVKKAETVDICICCGDFTYFSAEMEEVLDYLGKNIKKPLFMIHGNHEDYDYFMTVSQRYPNIIPFHLTLAQIAPKIHLFGYGGGGFSFIEKNLEKAYAQLKKKLPKNTHLIFVTHAPPYGTQLDFLDEERGHRGCKTSKDIVKELQPLLALSGHFHETFGVHERLGKTLMLNPGDEGTILVIDEEKGTVKIEE